MGNIISYVKIFFPSWMAPLSKPPIEPLSIPRYRPIGSSDPEQDFPGFLFRGFSMKSGVDSRLNSPDAIVPRFFLDRDLAHYPFDEWDLEDRAENLSRHLYQHTESFESRFSSWSPSFKIAYLFALHGGSKAEKYIAILDTHQLPTQNPLQFSLDLIPDRYSGDYLVYGPIPRQAFSVVSVEELDELGLGKFEVVQGLCQQNVIRLSSGAKLTLVSDITVHRAKHVGLLFGGKYTLPVTMMALCFLNRGWFGNIDSEDVEIIQKTLACDPVFEIPEDFHLEQYLGTYHTKTMEDFEELQQFVNIVRCLSNDGKRMSNLPTALPEPVTELAAEENLN